MVREPPKEDVVPVEDKREKCPVEGCNFRAQTLGGIEAHHALHPGCPICSLAFMTTAKRDAHKTTHGENPFTCPVRGCAYTSRRKEDLASHFDTLHAPYEARRFPCTFEGCGFRAGRKSVLETHMIRRHSEICTVKCGFPDCHFTCKHAADLFSHNRHVHRMNLLPCRICLEPGTVADSRLWCNECKKDETLVAARKSSKARRRFEKEVAGFIREHARGLPSIVFDGSVFDKCIPCAGRTVRPDILIPVTPGFAIVIEIDEHGHASYDAICERARQDKISSILFETHKVHRCTFIRFNPHHGDSDPNKKLWELLEVFEDAVVHGDARLVARNIISEDIFIGFSERRKKELLAVEDITRREALALHASARP